MNPNRLGNKNSKEKTRPKSTGNQSNFYVCLAVLSNLAFIFLLSFAHLIEFSLGTVITTVSTQILLYII